MASLGVARQQWWSPYALLGIDVTASPRRPGRIAGSDLATLIFCCKESVYKAVYPLVGEFLEFQDIEISLADDGFAVNCLNDRESNPYIQAVMGYFEVRDALTMSLFSIK